MFVISLIIIKVANCERTLCIPQAHCLEGSVVCYFSAHGHHKFIFNFFVIRIFQKNVKAYDCILSGRNLDTYDFDNLLPSSLFLSSPRYLLVISFNNTVLAALKVLFNVGDVLQT